MEVWIRSFVCEFEGRARGAESDGDIMNLTRCIERRVQSTASLEDYRISARSR
jgi:hypothetical protein